MERNIIDCLIIGHYDVPTEETYSTLSLVKNYSSAYKDFNMGIVNYKDQPYTITQLFNLFQETNSGETEKRFYKKDTLTSTISYLGSFLDRNNLTFKYITNVNEELNKLIEYLREYEIKTIAITTTLYVVSTPVEHIIGLIKRYNTDAKIIVGGPLIETVSRTINDIEEFDGFLVNLNADIYIKSMQGESTLVRIIECIKNNESFVNIPNIIFNQRNQVVHTDIHPENNILDQNLINWELFKNDSKKYILFRTAISCPFSCSFCGFPQRAGEYKTMPIDVIEKQLDSLVKNNSSLQRIYFIDDTFNVPLSRFKNILRMMISKNYGFKWHSYFRCQYADKETIKLMKESGCEGVFLGIESGSDTILKNMNKRATTKDYLKGIELLKEEGILTLGSFLTGFPGETLSTLKETMSFIENSGLDFYRTQLWYYEHITPIWENRKKYKIKGLGFNWQHETMHSKTAMDLVERFYLEIKNSTWLPQLDYDWMFIWSLISDGYELEHIKAVIISYNEMIKEKLSNPSIENCSPYLVEDFKQKCQLITS